MPHPPRQRLLIGSVCALLLSLSLPATASDEPPLPAASGANPALTTPPPKTAGGHEAHHAADAPATQAQPPSGEVATEGGCPAGCAIMACPPPNGPVSCCNVTTKKSC